MAEVKTDIDTWLTLWAAQCRGHGANLGYPKKVNFYTPPMNWADAPAEGDITSHDYEQANRLEALILYFFIEEQELMLCVREYYGAYPSAPRSRSDRLKKIDLSKPQIYKNVDRARYMLKGALAAG